MHGGKKKENAWEAFMAFGQVKYPGEVLQEGILQE